MKTTKPIICLLRTRFDYFFLSLKSFVVAAGRDVHDFIKIVDRKLKKAEKYIYKSMEVGKRKNRVHRVRASLEKEK